MRAKLSLQYIWPFSTDFFSKHVKGLLVNLMLKLNVVEMYEWYFKSISVYIIYPSNGLRYITQVPCYAHATCEISRFSA